MFPCWCTHNDSVLASRAAPTAAATAIQPAAAVGTSASTRRPRRWRKKPPRWGCEPTENSYVRKFACNLPIGLGGFFGRQGAGHSGWASRPLLRVGERTVLCPPPPSAAKKVAVFSSPLSLSLALSLRTPRCPRPFARVESPKGACQNDALFSAGAVEATEDLVADQKSLNYTVGYSRHRIRHCSSTRKRKRKNASTQET